MGLTSSMLVGLTGIKSNQTAIDTIGNNVANVNTTAFKSQRSLFETVFYHTISDGTAPSATGGGTNPRQIGFGSRVGAIDRNFGQGSVQPTGVASDLAIEGGGFFVLNTAAGDQAFTRDGAFVLNSNNVLVSTNGAFVRGFAADASGAVVPGALSDLTIPIGTESAAVATTTANFDGNLDAAALVASAGAVVTSGPLLTAGGAPATTATALTDLVDTDGAPLFADGDIVTIDGVQKGGVDLPSATFTVGATGSTVGDFAGFLETALGINTDPATGGSPGVTVADGPALPAGSLVIASNLGEANAISLDGAAIRNSTSGAAPFSFAGTPAVGEGTTTSLVAFDSLGNPVEVRLRFAMERKDASGTVWRFYAETPDETTGTAILGSGTVTFDQNGQFVAATGSDVSIDRSAAGAVSPLNVTLDFSELNGLAGGGEDSQVIMTTQDGASAGTLIDYAVGADGVITGTFSNGRTRVFGQIALATFANDKGLVANADNTYAVGVASGDPAITPPQTAGAGRVRSGALELSNVDLSREFIGLITASTGFSAASRVVRTSDDLLQELLLLVR